jgi:hypothetical protein
MMVMGLGGYLYVFSWTFIKTYYILHLIVYLQQYKKKLLRKFLPKVIFCTPDGRLESAKYIDLKKGYLSL